MAKKKRKLPVQKVRRTWGRNPAEKVHGTKKGARGYNRRRDKRPPEPEDQA